MLRPRFAGPLLLLFLPCFIDSQQLSEKTEPSETPEQKKAFELLETVASQISTLRSPENRIALSCAIADLLWNTDEKRARGLFEDVTKEMSSVVAEIDPSDPEAYNHYSWISQQRQEIVGRMAQRDPDLALSFLHATRFANAESRTFTSITERNLEFFLTRAIAAKDPERALRLAREGLAQGLSHELGSVLYELQRKSLPAARSLHESVVRRFKEEDLTRNPEAASIACNLLNSFSPPNANENTYRELLEAVIKAALTTNQNDPMSLQRAQNLHGNLRSVMNQVEKYAPARAQDLRLWSQNIERTFQQQNQVYNELNEVSQNGTVDDILALAAKFPTEMRSQIYQQAAWKASNAGDLARARVIATEMIPDPVQRRQVLEQLRNQAVWKSINENKLAEARALLNDSITVEQRVQVLARLASMLSGKDQKEDAIDCLNEARTLLESLPRNASRMAQQIQLANSYSLLDPGQSFTLMQSITSELNELVAAAAVMDGFENRYLKNGEWMTNGPTNLGNMVGNARRSLGHLARVDFDRARALTEKLERAEIRLMAQLDIAQMVLNSHGAESGLGQGERFSRRMR
ncbi:MAG TPA: hypothetical protein VI750_11965 [Pyrinomonadaceae bacterium]|nr:hypothetical protein [Pyrinomonadaceae bacterium]